MVLFSSRTGKWRIYHKSTQRDYDDYYDMDSDLAEADGRIDAADVTLKNIFK